MTIQVAKSALRYPPRMTWLAIATEVGLIALALIILKAAAG